MKILRNKSRRVKECVYTCILSCLHSHEVPKWRRCIVRNGWRIELLAKILEENKSLFFSATFYYASLLWHLKVQTARRLTPHANRPLERKLYGKILRYIFFCNFNCVWRIFGHDLPRIRWDGKQFNGSLLTVVLEKFYTISVVSGVNGSIWLPPLEESSMHRTIAHTALSATYVSAEGRIQSVLTKPCHQAFFGSVSEWDYIERQKN